MAFMIFISIELVLRIATKYLWKSISMKIMMRKRKNMK